MKSYKILAVFLLFMGIFASTALSAQDDREDVVYLKNGNIYRGMIIEQVPGVSIKVETIGGNVFNVAISDIIKTTREKRVEASAPAPPPAGAYPGYMRRDDRYHPGYHYSSADTNPRPGFHSRSRGYFFQAQFLVEAIEGGARIVNGYKFNRFAYLGVGIGVDLLYANAMNNANNSGVYLPLYIYYGGDILKKRITPFYAVEAGYALRVNPNNQSNNFPGASAFPGDRNATSGTGGMMGGAAFGVKFYSRHRVFFSLSANLDFKMSANNYTNYYVYPSGYYYPYNSKTTTTVAIPGIRLGLGF